MIVSMGRRKIVIDEAGSRILDECVARIASPKDKDFFKSILRDLVLNNAVPIDMLESIPLPPKEVGKTRFDQLYQASMAIVFPDYRERTLLRLLGKKHEEPEIKIWRVIFPEKYKLTHILLRAKTYQEAFALSCDYACRIHLYLFRQIPVDLTIRIMFMSESAIRRHLNLRETNRYKKRQEMKLEGREFTHKQISGSRLAALGPPKNHNHSIFKYVESRDLRRLRENGISRTSSVELESFRPSSRKQHS